MVLAFHKQEKDKSMMKKKELHFSYLIGFDDQIVAFDIENIWLR